MAHFIYEYSANLLPELDIADLMAALHDVAAQSGVFPLAGLRSRAVRCDDFLVADGAPDKAFVNLSIRMGPGRTLEVRRDVGSRLFNALLQQLQPVMAEHPVAISFEIRELDEHVRFNHRNFELC